MTYGNFKDLTRITASDKILRDKAFNIPKNTKYDGYQRRIASMVYKCFDKKSLGETIKDENLANKAFSEELQKAIIKNLKKKKAHSSFIDNIWSACFVNTQLISKFDKELVFY